MGVLASIAVLKLRELLRGTLDSTTSKVVYLEFLAKALNVWLD